VRVAEVDRDAGGDGEVCVAGHFLALVPGEGAGQAGGQRGDADPDWFAAMLGPFVRRTVDAAEEHHGGVPDDTPPTTGTVTLIAAVHCRYAPRGTDSGTSYPVPGSGVLAEVESADGWIADRGEKRFVGYLVQLKL
jgi:hypothetical protein